MKRIALLILCCCFILGTSAQYNNLRNNVWTFGNNARLDFTSGTPVPFASSIVASEGCASISNTAGSLLFYTDGKKVYNRLGLLMPGGTAIVPFFTSSATQGTLIVPFINDSNKYYIFSVQQHEQPGGQLAYTIIDMTLDGGFGDIVAGSAGTVINVDMSEKMIAIPGNACNIWLMTHKKSSAQFYAYEITSTGISSAPVISYEGTFIGINCYEAGVIKCSPDRQKIASLSYHIGPMWGVELLDFNPATGTVSNCRVLESNPAINNYYGAEFSPDNSKLYATVNSVFQWDLSLPTTAAVIASKTTISTGTPQGDLKTGPDGKIYVGSHGGTFFLDCINFPNAAGAACGYVPHAVNISPATIVYGLPNVVWDVQPIEGPSTICVGATTTLTTSFTGGIWSSSNPAVATISTAGVLAAISPGTATISYEAGSFCDGAITIIVVPPPTLSSVSICIGNTTTLIASTGGGTWSSGSLGVATVGSSSGIVMGVAAGTALMTYNSTGCPIDVTTIVTVNTLPIAGGGIVCLGTTLTMSSTTPGGTWSSSSSSTATIGSSSGVVTGLTTGTAEITYVVGAGCTNAALVTVTALPITGGAVCPGSILSLSSTVPGGTWSSGSPSTATVGSSSGVVTGITAGTVAMTYSALGCTNITIVTVNSAVALPPGTVCAGSSLTLTGSTPGGTWSSSDATVATVGLTTGVVFGAAVGTATIYYHTASDCPELKTVTVNAGPGPIGGKLTLCETFSTMLNCSPAGGTWSSSVPNVTISSSGMATGVTTGTATITYMLPGGCYSTAIVTINSLPAAITGPTTVTAGSTITLSNATPGGSWTSGDSSKAEPATTGVITGMTPGTATIYYTLPTGCKQSVVITVTSKNSVHVTSVQIAKPVLYPNPTTNEIIVKTERSAFTSFTIYNAIGQQVATYEITDAEMNLNVKAFPPGEYQVVFKGSAAREVIRFTKW